MQAVLEGRSAYDDLPDYLQSAIQFQIYEIACSVVGHATREERRAALAAQPELIRPHVEKLARLIFEKRKAAVTK